FFRWRSVVPPEIGSRAAEAAGTKARSAATARAAPTIIRSATGRVEAWVMTSFRSCMVPTCFTRINTSPARCSGRLPRWWGTCRGASWLGEGRSGGFEQRPAQLRLALRAEENPQDPAVRAEHERGRQAAGDAV